MREAMQGLRQRTRGEDGMTLVELLVATMILGIVMIVVSSVFASVERSIVLQNNLSTTLDQGRLVLEQLDRELRSGNVLYDPSLENNGVASCTGCVAGYTLRIYTQSNADTSSGYRCELWKIDTSKQLLVRTWAPDDPTGPSTTDWRVVATGVVNRTLGTAAFSLDPDSLKASRTLDITLSMNNDYTNHPTQTETLREALTGRDTSYGFPSNVCASVPSG
jgi:prepilin-type N-terminal cleavage/methylation domain-containing protein